MLIFLYGPDTYRSRQKLNEITEHYKKVHKSGLNLRHLDLEEKDFQDFRDEFLSISMFGEKKLFVLEGAFSNKDFKEKFFKNNKNFLKTEDIILFYERKSLSKKNGALFLFLEKEAKAQKFDFLTSQKLKNWVKTEFKKLEGKIEESALQELIDFVGSDTWQMAQEVKKLVNYKKGPAFAKATAGKGKEIQRKDVESLVKPKIEPDIFETIEALALKNKKLALRLIHHHIEKGDNPLYLLSMINFQFRNLLIVKSLSRQYRDFYPISKASGLHPFVAKKAFFQAQKFEFAELKKIYQKIFQADLDIKTGKVEPETALDLLITGI